MRSVVTAQLAGGLTVAFGAAAGVYAVASIVIDALRLVVSPWIG